jgi:hypothetical protein
MRLLVLGLICTALAGGQWIKHPTPGIPRHPDGTPNLEAPAPRTADGLPDVSGLWMAVNGTRYTVNLSADLPAGAVQMLPWAEAEYQRRRDTHSKDDPVGYCNLPGVPQVNAIPYPYKILQNATQITFLYEAIRTFREVFIDGRGFPEEMQPAWLGYSVGRFEGDTLVIETRGQNDKTWIDTGGHPHTEQLVVTERFRRRNFGNMDLEITIDDPGAYRQPWTARYSLRLLPDTEILEYVCTENNKDIEHCQPTLEMSPLLPR